MDVKRSVKRFVAYLLTLCMVMPSLCLAGDSTVKAAETDAAQAAEEGNEAAGAGTAAAEPESVSADDAAAMGLEAIMEEIDALTADAETGAAETDEALDAETGAAETDEALDAETVAADQLKTGTNYEIIVKSTGMAMTVSGYSDGQSAEICQMPANEYKSQIWTLDDMGGGYYRIVNKSSGRALNVPNASTKEGTVIIQWNKENSDNSQWKIEDVGDGLCRITPKKVDTFALNINGNSKDRGAKVIQWTYAGANNEKWEFREIQESAIKDNPTLETPSKSDVKAAVDAWFNIFYYEEYDANEKKTFGKISEDHEPWYGFWTDAEILEVMIDAYERLGDQAYLTKAERYYDWFIKRRTTDWRSGNKNEYNDDILWMSLATIRLYLNTGNEEHYKVAKFNIEDMYNTQWDDKIGGGLWWKNRNRGDKPTKNTCVNGPGGLAVYLLAEAAEARGDKADADKYYKWAKDTADWLLNVMYQADGSVKDNITEEGYAKNPKEYGGYISTGTQGNSLGVFALAYKHTKDQKYLDAARQVGVHTSTKMGEGTDQILNREYKETDGCGGKGILGRWLGYAVDEVKLTDFNDWMLNNAKSAWTNRNADKLMWSQFGAPTPEDMQNSNFAIDQNAKLKQFSAWNSSAAVAWLLATPGLGNAGVPDVPADGTTNWNVQSPNGKTVISFDLQQNGSLYYTASQDGKTVVESSPMGINTSAGDFTNGLVYKGVTEKKINETYDTFSGKKDKYINHCKEKTITFAKGGVEFSIIARAYDDGVAFRYAINTGDNRELKIEPNKEITGIKLPNNSDIWEMSCVDDNGNITDSFMYEQRFNAVNTGSMDNGAEPTMPMLYKSGDKYTLVTEAQKSGSYVGSHFKYEKNDRLLRFRFDNAQKDAVKTNAPFQSPWRSFVIGGLDAIVNNTMVENLSPAMKTEYDFASWVEPGVSSWSWVANWGKGISDQANPDTHKRWIDLAADMGWKYYILDERWQPGSKTAGSNYEGMYDWFADVAQYAQDKGVKLIAWVNKNDVDTAPEREARFKEWSEAGISGIKVDFFYNEKQSTLQLHEDIYAAAAKYRLLVNVHGSNPPSGEIRTYPNVIAREAIRGQETGGITAEQYTILPFTRGAVGTADVTEEIRSKDAGKTTMGFQIALSTLFENGIHSLGSQPQDYYNVPAGVSYYKNFPARWNDLRYLDSQIGVYVNLARKAGDVWYAAGISVDARDMKWKPTFLEAGKKYTAIKYLEKDGQRQDLKTETQQDVTSDTELSFHVQNGGGYAVKFIPQEGLNLALRAFPSEVKIQELGEKQVTVMFTPADTTLADVTWSVEQPEIAQVTSTASGAVIKGLKEGKTKVTVTSAFDKSKKAEINVEVTKGKYAFNTGSWEVFNNNNKYSINGENSISIQTENGVIEKNVFAMKAPTGDFTIEGKISGDLNSNYEGGFIGAFVKGSLNNYVSVGRRFHTSFDTGGTYKNNHFAMMSGNKNIEFYAKDDDKTKPVYVKLEKKGNLFTGYYSYDNKNWTKVTDYKNEKGPDIDNAAVAGNNNLYIGFYASSGGSNAETIVTFEDFKLNGNVVKFASTNAGVAQGETFSVEFDSAGGTAVAPQFVQSGQKATKPADPTRADATFQGWYAGSQPYDFNTAVTKDILLTARWTLDNLFTVSVEGESAKRVNGASLIATEDSSNGYYIGNVGVGNGAVTFTVTAETDGPRTMKVYYSTIGDRNLNIAVNGVSTVVNCPNTGSWDKPGNPVVVEITLKQGENTIQFSGANGNPAPNIDRFELSLTEKEAIDVVSALINSIPDEVTDSKENKALINGVKQTFDSLDEAIKSEIKNADKLNKALAALGNGGTTEEPIEPCAHLETVRENAKPASCKEEGYEGDLYCKICGVLIREGKTIPKEEGNHVWDAGVVTEPSEGKDREITFTCTVCGESYTVSIPCGHTDIERKGVVKATCGKTGYTGDIYCAECGELKEEGTDIPATGNHTWGDGNVTENSDGGKEITYECTVCGVTNTISMLCEHTETERRYEKPATCGEDGYTGDIYCIGCKELVSEGTTIPATGDHEWDEGKVTKEPKAGEDGEKLYTCTVCKATYTDTFQCSHNEIERRNEQKAACSKDGYSGDLYCKECGEMVAKGENIPATGNHRWDNGVVTKEATKEEAGEITLTCTVCKEKYTVTYESGNPNEETDREAADSVKKMISAIGTVTLDREKAIQDARKAFEDLSKPQQYYVTNIGVLEAAEERLEEVKTEAVNDVISKINAIAKSDIKPDDETKIKEARAAYEALAPELQKRVGENLINSLATAEKKLEEIKAAENQNPGETVGGKTDAEDKGKVKAKSIKITGYKKIAAGKKTTLKAEVSPENATDASVTWSSSNTKYATVTQKGVVKTKKAGKGKKVKITAIANDGSGVKASYTITIMPNAVKKVKIEAKSKTVKAGKSLKLKAVVTPNLSSKKVNKTVEWTSSNTKYATVTKKGVVKTKKAGKGKKVKITAKATDGSNKSAKITISIK